MNHDTVASVATPLELALLPVRPLPAVNYRADIKLVRLPVSEVREDAPRLELSGAAAVADYMAGAFDAFPDQEQMWAILLNRRNRPIGRQLCSVGTGHNALATPVILFRAAILASAAGVILAHNHPSGIPEPSSADMRVARQLKEAARTVEIDLLDFIILGSRAADPAGLGYYSFRTAGLL